jgi:hypothetical protein
MLMREVGITVSRPWWLRAWLSNARASQAHAVYSQGSTYLIRQTDLLRPIFVEVVGPTILNSPPVVRRMADPLQSYA